MSSQYDIKLQAFREKAAKASCGSTSMEYIYEYVSSVIKDLPINEKILDYGAGIGCFTRLLLSQSRYSSLWAADLYDCPVDLKENVQWVKADLNQPASIPDGFFNLIVSIETIEHLENPRFQFRQWHSKLAEGGYLIVTTPNCESLLSVVYLMLKGTFSSLSDASYPAHITALVRKDFDRICQETYFEQKSIAYIPNGRIPYTNLSWDKLSFGILRGKRFSDVIILVARKKPVD